MTNRIVFLCTPDRPPIEAEQVLRSFGIPVSARRWTDEDADGLREVSFNVPSKRLRWAASLLAGEGFTVLQPTNVRGTKPRSRWGVERRSHSPQSLAVYLLESLLGSQHHRKAPVKRGRTR